MQAVLYIFIPFTKESKRELLTTNSPHPTSPHRRGGVYIFSPSFEGELVGVTVVAKSS
jgi:hypothetical protein